MRQVYPFCVIWAKRPRHSGNRSEFDCLMKRINYSKLSLNLTSLMCEYKLRREKMAEQFEFPQAFSAYAEKMIVTIFIHCKEDATFKVDGVRMLSDTGTVRTAEVDFYRVLSSEAVHDGLINLINDGSVRYISASMQLKPMNDIAAQKSGLNNFRQIHSNLNGSGVVVGIIDSGIDASHPAFAGRIHSIWDQTITDSDKKTIPYGKVFIGENLAESPDTSGHGTHVAGIAAGFDNKFGGVAPAADIVVVKTDFQSAHIADAIRHIFKIAKDLGKPAVINLSAGGNLDSHDGTDDLSKFIEQELKGQKGRIVVAAAGNDADDQTHARIRIENTIEPNQTKEITVNVPKWEVGLKKVKQFVLRGWYNSDTNCLIEFFSPTGSFKAHTQLPIPPGVELAHVSPSRYFAYRNERAEAFIARTLLPCPLNDSHEFWVNTRRLSRSPLHNGNWTLKITNLGNMPATVDVWLWAPEGAREVKFTSASNNTSMKIGSPGCAGEAITVASYTTRTKEPSPFNVDTISPFSSPGPLRNEALKKPDVAAPGAIIISANSSQSGTQPSNAGGFTESSGTSMAAAFITGVCALLLQNNRELTPSEIKTWLQDNSRIPGQPAGRHDEKWGYGFLDLTNLGNLP